MNRRSSLIRRLQRGAAITGDEALAILRWPDGELDVLLELANRLRESRLGRGIECCSIVNARSGRCGEDCHYCAQSSHYSTKSDVYPLLDESSLLRARASFPGELRGRFAIVTSGGALTESELDKIESLLLRHPDERVSWCASLGMLDEDALRRLKKAGLKRYHHNLETAAGHFPRICTTHTYEQRLETVLAAKRAGMEVCCGALFGLGESPRQRVELALALRDLEVDCIPLNFLIPIPGTPLARNPPAFSEADILRLIAMFRFLMPGQSIRICGGREHYLSAAAMDQIFAAGADAIMIGGYLTRQGRAVADDLAMIERAGRLPLAGQGGQMNARLEIRRELDLLRQRHTFRQLPPRPGEASASDRTSPEDFLLFNSNDYLGLADDERVKAGAVAAISRWGCGATGSRLMSGNLKVHRETEKCFADWLAYPDGILFGSGFLGNLGILTAMADKQTVILEDRLNHASLLDGARLSGARLIRYRHRDTDHLRRLLQQYAGARRCLVVTDTLFSMDGDMAPLADIERLCADYNVLWIADEAHALGVYGPAGRGCCAQTGARPALLVSTFSKALGGYGGLVAVDDRELRDYMINRARSLIFSTAPAPACLGAAKAALEVILANPGLGETLLRNSALFRDELRRQGLDTGDGQSQIIPVMLGDNATALEVAQSLEQKKLVVTAIRPPTVPPGTSRLRLSVTLKHSPDALARAAGMIGDAIESAGGAG